VIGVSIVPRHNVAPVGTNTGWNPEKTRIRNEVNQWIRAKAPFDAVIDFDRIVRDPINPDLLRSSFNCGDGIHPSPAGYYAMGKAIELRLFQH
jgi:lysophospholipase L1-like esterase